MELKYVVMIIVKIIISVPTILILLPSGAYCAALMGGHIDNTKPNLTLTEDFLTNATVGNVTNDDYYDDEEIPDPSPLVLPGYNLPENIFNKGKPFYLERDPVTGEINFDSKNPSLDNMEEFDYIEDEPSSNIYDKANIDRKDGGLASHRPSDINQLTPNIHDFLNLPVKYNPDKYVYPIISSSYANTKFQGNVNKYGHNHKDYKVTTYKPTMSPTYFTKTPYFKPEHNPTQKIEYKTTTTSPPITTTTSTTTTTKLTNLLNSAMNHPSYDYTNSNDVYFTTGNVNNIYLTTKAPTTHKPMSLLEQLFGGFDEYSEKTTVPPLNVTKKPEIENVLTGSSMGEGVNYEYEDDYTGSVTDNIAVDSKPSFEVYSKPPERTTTTTTTSTTTTTPPTLITEEENRTTTLSPLKVTSLPLGENHFGHNLPPIIAITHNLKEQLNNEKVPKPIEKKPVPSTTSVHIAPDQDTVSFVVGHQQNVEGTGQYVGTAFKESPYDPNPFRPIYTQPGQTSDDTVSFSVQKPQFHQATISQKPAESPQLHQPTFSQKPAESQFHQPTFSQKLAESQFHQPTFSQKPAESQFHQPTFSQKPAESQFHQPTFSQKPAESQFHQPIFSQKPAENPEFYQPTFPFSQKTAEVGGGTVNMQPIRNSETSIAIGVPVGNVKVVPGQVVDEKLENEKIEFPKGAGAKVVFPDEKPTSIPEKNPSPILNLSSQPMYHQLPSDLTPPAESEVPRPRPPWDPRPGHFHTGRPEYVRPPRPLQKNPHKRIDNLPNILPQFRPNMKAGAHYMDNFKAYLRQPLLDRPSNRPSGFFDKLVPPPPPKNLHNLRKVPALEHELKKKVDDRIGYDLPRNPHDFGFFTPPKVVLANRRSDVPEIETLQMIQAKADKKEKIESISPSTTHKINVNGKDTFEKPLYVVYPVNSAPIKLDALDADKKEAVVIGTRAELPLPPSKINQEFNFENRNDSPILKPHPRPASIKSDFPYHLEKPAISESQNKLDDEFNEWTEARIVNSKINYKNPDEISVTLKTFTEKPIAVAYTPTEPNQKLENYDKFSMPNYGTPVISEIRPGTSNSEFTVSAVMHTHPQDLDYPNRRNDEPKEKVEVEGESTNAPPKLDFQAPFQASVNVDNVSQGWKVIRDKNKTESSTEAPATTLGAAGSTGDFDIENFQPQLFGGFKPIYSQEEAKSEEAEVGDREEREI